MKYKYEIQDINNKKYIVIEDAINGESLMIESNHRLYTQGADSYNEISEATLDLVYNTEKSIIEYKMSIKYKSTDIIVYKNVDIDLLADVLIDCIKNRKTLEETVFLNDLILEMHTKCVAAGYKERSCLYSDKLVQGYQSTIPIKATVELYKDNIRVGWASAVMFGKTKLTIIGSTHIKNNKTPNSILIHINGTCHHYMCNEINLINEIDGVCVYICFPLCIKNSSQTVDSPESRLHFPANCSSSVLEYILQHNSKESIKKYINDRKPKKIMININSYLVNEFNKIKKGEKKDVL